MEINQYLPNGNRDGQWESYFSNGQLHYKGNYINGNEDGQWECYVSNGQLSSKGNYIKDNGERMLYLDIRKE